MSQRWHAWLTRHQKNLGQTWRWSWMDELTPICQMNYLLLGGSTTCRRESLEPPQSLILRYRWNRLHVLFTLAATYIIHYTDMKTYLTTRCLHKSDLVTSLIKDYTDDPTTMLQLKVLAIIGKILSGPWFKHFYRTHERQVHHLDAFAAIKECYSRMKAIASKDIYLLADITHDLFGDPISQINKILWTLNGDSVDQYQMHPSVNKGSRL